MSDMTFAFYGEGHAESGFLLVVVRRLLKAWLPHLDFQGIDFTHDTRIRAHAAYKDKVLEAARLADGYHFLVLHRDADRSDAESARANLLVPAAEHVRQHQDAQHALVPVIPIRNTEAWMLTDFAAFGRVVRTGDAKPDAYGFPSSPREVETLSDPKGAFQNAVRQSRSRVAPGEVYAPLAQGIALDLLEQVPAVARFRADFMAMAGELYAYWLSSR